ncbi:MAG: LamG domain-containing protein, partial [Clostridiales bacterium]|nr:LamG domain-containing protein [Clostridiales bacterium]
MKEKAIKRTSVFAALLFACILFATALAVFPNSVTYASADAAADTAARNANLIVKYDMGNIADGKIKASKWENGKYVPYDAMDAAIQGTVTSSEGNEGSGAARFSSANATAKTTGTLQLPSGATGLTVTAWIKNLVGDWGSLVELFGGTQGGRFGRGTVGYNNGTYNNGDWGNRTYPGAGASFPNGGSWNSFVTNNDGGNSGTDACNANTWYFVAFTLTQNSLIHYKNAVDKIVYPNSGDEKAERIVSNIWQGVANGNSKIALRPEYYDGTALGANEEIDDLRFYNGAMTQAEVAAVYKEYQIIAALGQKTLKTDDANFGNVEVGLKDGGGVDIVVSDMTAAFPKLLIGGAAAADVTENAGTFSYTGSDFSYNYTVSGDVA